MYWFLLTICKTDSLGTTCDKGLAVLKIDINIQIVEVYQNHALLRALDRLLTQHLNGQGLHTCGRARYAIARAIALRGPYALFLRHGGLRAAQHQRRTYSLCCVDFEIADFKHKIFLL